MPGRPYAVFDIDGTLIRWQLYHALADALAKARVIDSSEYQSILLARRNWKVRRSGSSFVDYENALIKLIDRSLRGIDYEAFSQTCRDVVERYQDQVYTFTRDLIADLRQQNYLTFAVSASPHELVAQVAAHYSFDDFAGSEYGVAGGKLTGQKRLLLGAAKPARLKELIKKYGALSTDSVAVGDTASDSAMLALAERPIAFNPAQELFNLAIKNRWEVVIERKNVVYNLQYSHGTYVLIPPGTKQTLIL